MSSVIVERTALSVEQFLRNSPLSVRDIRRGWLISQEDLSSFIKKGKISLTYTTITVPLLYPTSTGKVSKSELFFSPMRANWDRKMNDPSNHARGHSFNEAGPSNESLNKTKSSGKGFCALLLMLLPPMMLLLWMKNPFTRAIFFAFDVGKSIPDTNQPECKRFWRKEYYSERTKISACCKWVRRSLGWLTFCFGR